MLPATSHMLPVICITHQMNLEDEPRTSMLAAKRSSALIHTDYPLRPFINHNLDQSTLNYFSAITILKIPSYNSKKLTLLLFSSQ